MIRVTLHNRKRAEWVRGISLETLDRRLGAPYLHTRYILCSSLSASATKCLHEMTNYRMQILELKCAQRMTFTSLMPIWTSGFTQCKFAAPTCIALVALVLKPKKSIASAVLPNMLHQYARLCCIQSCVPLRLTLFRAFSSRL